MTPDIDSEPGAEPLAPSLEEAVEGEPVEPEPVTAAPAELPSWLYERPGEEPEQPERVTEAPSPTPAEPVDEQEPNKHLRGIRGVLPRVDGWVASSLSRYLEGPKDGGETSGPASNE